MALIGADGCTPYASVGFYCSGGPAAIRGAGPAYAANLAHMNFDLGGPVFPVGVSAVDSVVRPSLTYDRGLKMACHPELARRLKIDIWICDPYSPWQRGSNENTSGLLRQFLPKGADLSARTQRDLDYIATLMNDRPRKTLGWRTPAEALAAEIAKGVAIGT